MLFIYNTLAQKLIKYNKELINKSGMTKIVKSKAKIPVKHQKKQPSDKTRQTREIGGPSGPEPTRYGDWERKGRCIDF